MKTLSLILILMLCACNDQSKESKTKIMEILDIKLQHSLISKGDNFPDFNPYNDSLDYYLFLIHNDMPIKEIVKHTSFTNQKIDSINNFLIQKKWLRVENEIPIPTIFIANEKDGIFLFNKAKPISKLIVKSIEEFMPNIKKTFRTLDLSKEDSFEKWSFLILSNVLLDSWQIDNVETEFLKAPERPDRNNKNYYYSIMELKGKTESFGIYGNQYEEINNKFISIYGNNRAIAVSETENKITGNDNINLTNLATEFKPYLIDIFNKETEYIRNIYNESGYSKKISFQEFFIWWYHFIYTDVTNILDEKGILTIPKDGNFYYEIEN